VADTVRALLALLDHPEKTEGQVFNVGSDQEITIQQLAERVIEETGAHTELRFVPYSEAYAPGFEDMRRRVPDTTKIREAVGWQPQRTLDDILADVIAYERARLS
jgi:UDP-glucose 4-epimerase